MSLFSAPTPTAAAVPPPPPAAPSLGQDSIQSEGAQQKQSLLSAEGEGLNGTDVTGGQGAANPNTTKSLLGG